MKYSLTNNELRELIGIENLRHPAMNDTVRADLGVAAQAIDEVGLPIEFADWFKCVEAVVPFTDAQGKTYFVDNSEIAIERAVTVGRGEFGTHVIDCNSGCVVYIDSSGDTQLINTSVDRFLQFIAHFNRASNERFENCHVLRTAFDQVDRAALRDPEGIWSVMLESAEAGLF